MSTISETINIIANTIVMRSRFFSTILVPVCVEYTELAIMSDMPVPLPEWSKIKMIRPMPDTTSKTSIIIRSGFTINFFFLL